MNDLRDALETYGLISRIGLSLEMDPYINLNPWNNFLSNSEKLGIMQKRGIITEAEAVGLQQYLNNNKNQGELENVRNIL